MRKYNLKKLQCHDLTSDKNELGFSDELVGN
jgi:hypothetical protein